MTKKRSSDVRRRAEGFLCRLLSAVCWTLLSRAEQREALVTAREFGREFADVWDDEPTRAAFCDTAIWWCWENSHCNTVEVSLWRESPGLAADPRIAAWAAGCYERRAELGN